LKATLKPYTERPPLPARRYCEGMKRILLTLLLACGEPKSTVSDPESTWEQLNDPMVAPLVLAMGPRPTPVIDPTNQYSGNPTAIAFGRRLFYDRRLSGDGHASCATCHDPQRGFSDGLPVADIGLAAARDLPDTGILSDDSGTLDKHLPQVGDPPPVVSGFPRHSPSIWNTGYNRWQFWDGRCDTLWCQAIQPIEADLELGLARTDLAIRVSTDPELAASYLEVFGERPEFLAVADRYDLSDGFPDFHAPARFPTGARPTPTNPESPANISWERMDALDQAAVNRVLVDIAKAIAAFEETVVSGEAPVDRFVAAFATNDRQQAEETLDSAAIRGLALFAGEGQCVNCHLGPLFTNFEFSGVGLGDRSWLDPADSGRYAGTDRLLTESFSANGVWSDAPQGEKAQALSLLQLTTDKVGQFKVPSLREVAQSAPYMHGGHFEDLDAVITHYVELDETPTLGHTEEVLQPLDWGDQEKSDLRAFLESLSQDQVAPDVLEP
jgi:cytochrome c peroxidase